MNGCRILVDLDNTLLDFSHAISHALAPLFPNLEVLGDKCQWSLHLDDAEYHKAYKMAQLEPGFWLNLKAYPGALEALEEMKQQGHSVWLCSSPSSRSETCHSEKASWIKKHMSAWWAKRLILCKDKTLIRGDYLIDDNAYIRGECDPEWTHILYAQPYNQGLPDEEQKHYLQEWSDWKSILSL